MSSTTSRVAFYKPAGGENVNVTTDLNNNLDKIDTNLNFRVVANAAARNAISPFWAGLNVRETDTGKLYVSNGSAPISASWDQILTSGTYGSAVNLNPSATGSVALNMRPGANTQNRFQLRGDGQLAWGTGSATPDVNLYRSGSNTLKTDDALEVEDLSVGGFGIEVISDWALLSSVGSFATNYSAGTPAPYIRKINLLGTEIWEMKGRITFGGTTTGGLIFTFTGGSGSAYTPSIEHNYSIVGGPSSSVTASQRLYWNTGGGIGISPSFSAGGITYIALDTVRIVDPLA